MDGLEEFEKTLAAGEADRRRAERDVEKRRHRKQRHHHRRHHDNSDRDRQEDGAGNGDADGDRNGEGDKHGNTSRDKCRARDRDRHQDIHHHRRHHDHDDDGHRHKRSRHSRNDDDDDNEHIHRSSHSHRGRRQDRRSDSKEDMPYPDDEKPPHHNTVDSHQSSQPLARDAWMMAPSAIQVERINRPLRDKPKSPTREKPRRVVHKRELNSRLQALTDEASLAVPDASGQRMIDYAFGDAGSSWRMKKLKAVYNAAEESRRPVEEVALERFGSLEEFDDAREEKEELDRRRIYGEGYEEQDKPTGDLYHQRAREHAAREPSPEPQGGTVMTQEKPQTPPMDQTTLNRLRAQMLKAKLRRAPNAAQLEAEYNRQAARPRAPQAVVLGVMDSRQLAGTRGEAKAVGTRRGRERGAVEANEDMSIDDMVREERRTKGQAGGEGMRLAERIAKDAKYDDDLEYMDENAEKLARRVHKSEINLKNMAVSEFQKMNRILDSCPLCHHEETGRPPVAPVVALATRVYLTLAPEPEVSEGGAVIVPVSHHGNLLECDDDEWEEIRNFMKSLTRLYHDQGRDVIFYEDAAAVGRRRHAAMVAVPIPYAEGATAPAHFREAFLAEGDEWSQHPKIIDTAARAARDGRMAFRRSIAREMPYFHVWFGLDGGLGHVVDDAARWPRGDTFARGIVGGIVGAEPHIVNKQGRWTRADARVDAWKRAWHRFDWTRMLVDASPAV